MDYLQSLINQTRLRLFSVILLLSLALIGLGYVLNSVVQLKSYETLAALVVFAIIESFVATMFLSDNLLEPIKALWQSIMHLSPDSSGVAAPSKKQLSLGKELVENLTTQIYQLINVANATQSENKDKLKDLSNNFIAQNLPLPLIVLDQSETIKFANQAIADYIGIPAKDMVGKNIYMVLDMSFQSEDTFDNWLKTAKTDSAKSSKSWERVKLSVRDNHPTRMFDLAAYYNKDNPDKNETMLVLFDHTKLYSQEDQAISFIALSVHELRSPLTLLRGYIEVFKEELDPVIDEELHGFMDKMQSQAELLMAYVNNILNVARVDDDQLELRLAESDWSTILTGSIKALSLRAKVRGITLHTSIDKGIPAVGVDRISIQEVINNLVDNAIKYSGKSKDINISSRLKNGLVETTIQDFGLGIPSAVLPNLFTKFYRDHHNRSQIGGTGLGLYLSKAIVKAHGGNLWVRSEEGKGSTFGFTLLPFKELSEDAKSSNGQDLVRTAHGWIKNHSLYRR